MNILVDLNIILDYYSNERRVKFKESVEALTNLFKSQNYVAYISSSSLDNLEFIKASELKRGFGYADKRILKNFILEILTLFKIAKTPSYLELDYDDIEDSQVIASAKAVDAKVLTRDKGMLEKYSNIALAPKD
ncbi:aminotransferase, partial [Sulfurovum sp. bin170]|uniref:PIN domain-containing protein n=1 Tax=Sulfurovum sp. bin170 TaxID=2695268 RepID=UPI0014188E13